jgi:hypothetical protein
MHSSYPLSDDTIARQLKMAAGCLMSLTVFLKIQEHAHGIRKLLKSFITGLTMPGQSILRSITDENWKRRLLILATGMTICVAE